GVPPPLVVHSGGLRGVLGRWQPLPHEYETLGTPQRVQVVGVALSQTTGFRSIDVTFGNEPACEGAPAPSQCITRHQGVHDGVVRTHPSSAYGFPAGRPRGSR